MNKEQGISNDERPQASAENFELLKSIFLVPCSIFK